MAHAVPLGLSKKVSQKKSVQSSLCHCDCQKSLSKEFYVIVVVPLGFEIPRLSTKLYGTRCAIGIVEKNIVKKSLCNCRCAIEIWDTKAFSKTYMAHSVPLGLSKKIVKRSLCNRRCAIGIVEKLSKEVCVTVAVPLGLSKKIVKRSLCKSRCAVGIVKKVSQKKSVQSSLCHCDCQKSLSKEFYVIVVVPLGFEIPRLSTKLYGTRCAIGIVEKDCQKKSV